jgi:Na+/melibiose symporter-like transporter
MLISTFSARRGLPVTPVKTSIADSYRSGIAVLRRSQPFRVLLLAFLLQGLATGVMLAGAQYVATWVLGTGVTILFVSLIAPAVLFAPVSALVSRRLGKERTFVISSVLFLVAARRRTRRKLHEAEGIRVAPLWVALIRAWRRRPGASSSSQR